jgi:drug/metabolite transporter (DMT)-like permease
MSRKHVWILFTALAFGTMEIALKKGGCAFNPLQLTFLRFAIGGLFLAPFAWADRRRRVAAGEAPLSRGDIAYCAMLGLVGIVGSMTLFQLSVQHSNANLAAVLISINPVFTMVFAHFVAGERFTARKALVLAVCLAGLALVAAPWKLADGNSARGILYGLGASVAFGLYTALSRRRIARVGGMAVNTLSFLIGSALELGVLLLRGDPVLAGIDRGSIGLLAYVSLVVTGFGYYSFMRAVEEAGASSASYAFFIKPPVAMVLAWLVLGEAITWNIVLGIVLIVAAFVWNVRATTHRKNP